LKIGVEISDSAAGAGAFRHGTLRRRSAGRLRYAILSHGKVVEFVNDALHIEGLTGKRRRQACRVSVIGVLEDLLGHPATSSSVVTCVFLDGEQMTQSVRKHARMPGAAWAASFKHSDGFCPASVASTCQQEGFPILDVLYERRSQITVDHSIKEICLTRKAITQDDYDVLVTSSSHAPAVTKYILRFVIDSHYYELICFDGQDHFILDFSDENPCLPTWLELMESSSPISLGATRADAQTAGSLKRHVASDQERDSPPSSGKRQRFLRSHSTEEAALFGTAHEARLFGC